MYDIVYYYLAVTMTILPSPHQQWSHSTNSLSKLFIAFEDSNITAVEADILMGHIADPSGKSSPSADKPIMAHPQHTQSDLSSCHFLDLVTSSTVNSRNRRTLRKHIKFDFKEMDAVEPTLLALQNLAPIGLAPIGSINETDDSEERQTVFLNADIFPGPGRRFQSGQLDAHDFVEICLRNITQLKERGVAVPFAFSLGFKVDYKSKQRYTPDDCRLMMDIVDRYSLSTEAGVVLALNARVLAIYPPAFDAFLNTYPSSQILAWTGTGEPPIRTETVNIIRHHFDEAKHASQLGFDCVIQQGN